MGRKSKHEEDQNEAAEPANAASREDAEVHEDVRSEHDAVTADEEEERNVPEHEAKLAELQDRQDVDERDDDLVTDIHAEGLKHGDLEHRDSLLQIKAALDAALGRFENTSDSSNLHAARVTIDGVRENLNAIRTMVQDALNALD